MSKQLLEDLIASKALIDSPAKWVQDTLAKTADGRQCGVTAPDAACFCSMGAYVHYLHGKLDYEARDKAVTEALDAAVMLATSGEVRSIVSYNDNYTYAEVMAIWDSAIADAEAAQ